MARRSELVPSIVQMNDEANLFALELLVPRSFLVQDLITAPGVDLGDDRIFERLAKKYKVSVPVLAVRIGMLLQERIDSSRSKEIVTKVDQLRKDFHTDSPKSA